MVIGPTYESPDKRLRKSGIPWVGIIIHHTGLPKEIPKTESSWDTYYKNIINWLTKKDNMYVSSHYIISRAGDITLMVNPDTHVAYHSGKSSFWNPYSRQWITGCNDYFIGVELIGDGNRINYSDEQYKSLALICNILMSDYPTILPNNIVGHEMVSPGRKVDPGAAFDWKKFYKILYAPKNEARPQSTTAYILDNNNFAVR